MTAGELQMATSRLAPDIPVKIVIRGNSGRAVLEQPIKDLIVRFEPDGRPVLTIEA